MNIRQSMAAGFLLSAALFLIPLFTVEPYSFAEPERHEGPVEEQEEQGIPQEPASEQVRDRHTILKVLSGETVTEMTMEEYLAGVVRAEMPAGFELEALKAQATAARTYTLYKMQSGGNHGETADICTDSACCQAFTGEAEAKVNWGEMAEQYEQKIRRAVAETDGQAVLFGGVPVLAVFHASSAGQTRPAGEVWSSDLPYLQAVTSQEAGASIPNYYSRTVFELDVFSAKLKEAYDGIVLSDDPREWLREPVTDSVGNVRTVNVGGLTVKGTSLRNTLGLRSACFEWEIQGDSIVFFTTGHGHGVGMSQYGANQMAEDGADWKSILTHYYTGVSVEAYDFTNAFAA